MSRTFLISHTLTPSAKALKDALNIRRIRSKGSKYVGQHGDVVVNFGVGAASKYYHEHIRHRIHPDTTFVNHPGRVTIAANKLLTFRALSDDGLDYILPQWTTDPTVVEDWDFPYVARESLTGSKGDGIILVEDPSMPVPDAKLYVKYIKKSQEYRVHCVNETAWVDRKARDYSVPDEEVDWKIRNHSNGFIYERDIEAPQEVLDAGVTAVDALDLDFGAVDVVWNAHYARAYVLEVNTAPGLVGQTLDKYVEGIRRTLQ